MNYCWELDSQVPTSADVVFEIRRKQHNGVQIGNTETEDFSDWVEFGRADHHTPFGNAGTCVKFAETIYGGRGTAMTVQFRMRQGDAVLKTLTRLDFHGLNLDTAELHSQLHWVFQLHTFDIYPNMITTGTFRTDLSFTDPEARFVNVGMVSGLTASDLRVTNGTVANVVPDRGAIYVITVEPTTLGEPVTMTLPQGVVHGVGARITPGGENTFTRPNQESDTLAVQTAAP